MLGLLFELRRLRETETKRVHSATLDNISFARKSRYFAPGSICRRIVARNTHPRIARHCNVRDRKRERERERESIIGKKRAPLAMLSENPRGENARHSLCRLLPVAMYIIAPSPFLLRYRLLPARRPARSSALVKRSLSSASRFDKSMQISKRRLSFDARNLPRDRPSLLLALAKRRGSLPEGTRITRTGPISTASIV